MANSWFRLYSEFASDPKVQRLSEADQRRFVMLLCMRCNVTLHVTLQESHVTIDDADVTFVLRISDQEWQQTKAILVSKKLIDEHNNPIAWNKRQYVSDSSAARVRKHREAKKKRELENKKDNVTCNVTKSVTVTPPDTDTDTDTDTDIKTITAAKHSLARAREDEPAAADPITHRAIELTTLLRKRGAALTASDPHVRRWASDGVTDAQALTALETANVRRSQAASPQPVNAGFLNSLICELRAPPPRKPEKFDPVAYVNRNRISLRKNPNESESGETIDSTAIRI